MNYTGRDVLLGGLLVALAIVDEKFLFRFYLVLSSWMINHELMEFQVGLRRTGRGPRGDLRARLLNDRELVAFLPFLASLPPMSMVSRPR